MAPVPRYQNPLRVLLVHRNFRLFWLGQTSSVIGTWMQSVAVGWLALELSNSAFVVGVVAAARSLPVLVLTLYGGVVADRYDKLRVVKATQVLLLVEALLLWWFDWSGHMTIAALMLLSLFGGAVNAFDIPARQALMIELTTREDLVDAIALNSSGFNLARIIGPSIAAVVIAKLGMSWCFALNALSYVFVIVALLMIHLVRQLQPAVTASPLEGLLEGARYMLRSREVTLLMAMVAVYSVFGIPFLVLMPVVARDVLHGDAQAYGLLLAAVGLGAVLGALSLAMAGHGVSRGRWLGYAAFGFCAALAAFSASRALWLSTALLVLVGFSMIQNNALANGLLQTLSPDGLRGRVMSAYALVFVGLAPVGSVLAGAVAQAFGAPAAIALGAVVMAAFAWWVFRVRAELVRL